MSGECSFLFLKLSEVTGGSDSLMDPNRIFTGWVRMPRIVSWRFAVSIPDPFAVTPMYAVGAMNWTKAL